MKRYLSIIILTLTSIVNYAQTDKIIGTWLTEDKEAHVKIYKSNNIYYGKIIWLKNPNDPKTGMAWLDKENKSISKRKLTILGSIMLKDFKYIKGEYIDGSVYDSRNGTTYSGKLWVENNGDLKMRGYWGFFYSTETWKKVTR
jgi:uncharacterized protein (DUF2147 family)